MLSVANLTFDRWRLITRHNTLELSSELLALLLHCEVHLALGLLLLDCIPLQSMQALLLRIRSSLGTFTIKLHTVLAEIT